MKLPIVRKGKDMPNRCVGITGESDEGEGGGVGGGEGINSPTLALTPSLLIKRSASDIFPVPAAAISSVVKLYRAANCGQRTQVNSNDCRNNSIQER